MNCLKLDGKDIVLENNKFTRLTDSKDALVQQITVQVTMLKNEWFLNPSIGIDYIGFENKRFNDKEIIDSIRQSLLLNQNVELVNKIEVSRDRAKRFLTVNIELETVEGSVTINI